MSVLALAELAELVWVAPLAAVAVCITFSATILGATRSSDARRDGRNGQGALWMALAVASGLATLTEVVLGILVIVTG